MHHRHKNFKTIVHDFWDLSALKKTTSKDQRASQPYLIHASLVNRGLPVNDNNDDDDDASPWLETSLWW